uniref:Peptidase M3A/M3B catalytic domain-containing protein n=1 Tax=Chromera velia CCMP2878 TaxID=1169474 RepID=A0A0G4GAJ1_9ALVE|eukprot:Cvel_21005.t1-p1 / transcript=Cvel_21005.t1 / gene=Cvel_21005 / organism=Chromera_velia_CCMP2878 / gene_product=Oligopeptidase A, putative / transcript_product=Oligopeptidase A, putative / location=Cvel_scaffold1935:13966-17113(-) / protein_length=656 / sequence_SO=supercontig / SO=protein_coding / is_pseudo=false
MALSARLLSLGICFSRSRLSRATGRVEKFFHTMSGGDVASFISEMNLKYDQKHKEFEDNFWATKMNLRGNSSDALAKTKTEYDEFLGDPENLKAVREFLKKGGLTPEQEKTLKVFERTFECYITEDPEARAIKEQLNKKEADLQILRNKMEFKYKDGETGEMKSASITQIRSKMRVDPNEATRKSCWEAMRTIGPYVAEPFLEIVKLRNKLARLLGYEDYYDYKVTQAEGFSKKKLFVMMDDLEQQTRPIMERAAKQLEADKGPEALHPWNTAFMLSGDIEKKMDPFFPFELAVDVWARTFAALGIEYKDATMRLDLCERAGKYPNGFCHWPQVAWRKADGNWIPSQANFTSLATPNQVGSGKTALVTLLHEGGHAAHFANIDQPSPFFGQERAPMSVAYAENQSMYLDAYATDAAWMARYARDREGNPIPWPLLEERIRSVHPQSVSMVRGMLAVPYFEKGLYEANEADLTPEFLQKLADDVELKIQGRLSARPLLSVPHILADESSAYYHGYVLAEMSVHQTREYFKKVLKGDIVDNKEVGKQLTEVYWRPGNSSMFLDLVEKLTGSPLKADAWVKELNTPTEDMVKEEAEEYKKALVKGPAIAPGSEVDLKMRVLLVHGDEVIADSKEAGLAKACGKFRQWVEEKFPRNAAAS